MRRLFLVGMTLLFVLESWCTQGMKVCATDEIQMGEIDEVLEEILPEQRVSFQDIVVALMSDDEKLEVELLGDFITDSLFYAVSVNKSTISYLLMLMIGAAIITNFSNVFKNRQVAETGFYLIYMLMIIVCLQTFLEISEMVKETIGNLLTFMRVLGPVYFLSMSVSTGNISSVTFYSLLLLLIYIVELVILNGLLPTVHVYLMIQVLNFLSDEVYLSKLSEFLNMLMGWVLKTLIACVTGVGMLQGLLVPHADELKRGAVYKVVNMFPGIGDALGVAGEMLVSTAVFLKNGIGMAGSILLILICLIPIVNMGILVVLYKGLAAICQPISDKRIVEMLTSVGETYLILLKIVFAVLFLFIISIALTAVFTS